MWSCEGSGLLDFNVGPSFGSYILIKKCCVKIPLFEDIVIVIMGALAITATKLHEGGARPTHKTAAKTSWHRYGTKLRHCYSG